VPGYEASFWTGVGAPRTLPPRSLVNSIGRATVDSRRRSFRWTRSPHPASGRIRRTRPASCRAGVTVPRLPLDGHPWASPQGSGLQAEICCAEGQQQQAECGNPGGVNKVRHTNKDGRKNTKLATAKLWTVRPLSTAKRGTGSCGGLPRQFVLATTARSRGTLWGDHRSDLQFGRAMVGGDLGRGICTSPGQGAFNRHMVGP
jgi:hypothetical protein